jgi:prepilin signal peptidase PulO-like enzyme (type II secretory pathway)
MRRESNPGLPLLSAGGQAGVATVEPAPGIDSTWRRPVVLAVAALLAVACVVRYSLEPRGFIAGFTAAVLVILAATDLEARVIPNKIVLPAIGLVLLGQLAFYSNQATEWIVSALATAAFLFVPTVINRGAIGMGDVKLALLLGVALGLAVLPALTLGFVAMLPVVLYLFIREGADARKMYLPLGPFLALGAVVALLTGGAA